MKNDDLLYGSLENGNLETKSNKFIDISPSDASWLALISAYKQYTYLRYLSQNALPIGIAILTGKGSKQNQKAAAGIIKWATQLKKR